LRGSRREAFRLRLFDALLFLLTVLFDIAAKDPTRQSISICPSALDLTQNTILGKYLHGWGTGLVLCEQPEVSDWCERGMPAMLHSRCCVIWSLRTTPGILDNPRADRTS
jgi:hypothetical protein